MAVGRIAWVATTGADVALSANTARSVIGVKAATDKAFKITEFGIGADGTDSTKGPILVQLLACTFATKPPGTNSTSITPVKISGIGATTTDATAAHSWEASNEPTVITVLKEWRSLDPNKGQLIMQFPLGREPESVVAQGFVLRCTAVAAVNVRAYIEWEE